jgi:predicted permease
MIFTNSFTMLLSALAPAVTLLLLGAILSLRRKTRGAISATALATGLALVVIMALVIGRRSLYALGGIEDSALFLSGLPLASFAIVLGILSHRDKLPVPRVAACGVVGVIGLWYLGGFVAITLACGVMSNGGC